MLAFLRRKTARSRGKAPLFRPRLEALEDRTVPSSYTVTELGTLGGAYSRTGGINDAGQVVGDATNYSGLFHAVLWQNGSISDLGTLGGAESQAQAINSAGQIVGWASTTSSRANAFLYQNSGMTDLGTLGGTASIAHAINDPGQIVGESYISANSAVHAFLYQNGEMSDLGTLGGSVNYSYAYGINNAGQVVGYSFTSGGESHAFLLTPEDTNGDGKPDLWFRDNDGNGANDLMADLGTLGGAQSVAYGINNMGQIVGGSTTSGYAPTHAFVYKNGLMTDLGTLGGSYSTAFPGGINDAGHIVGHTDFAGDSTGDGFIYENGAMRALGDLTGNSGWIFASPTAINSFGLIVGNGTNPDGAGRGFLLTPAHSLLRPTSLAWDDANGGVNYSYQITGVAPTQDTAIALYWSRSARFADHIGGPITKKVIPAGTPVGGYGPVPVPDWVLENDDPHSFRDVPDGAAYLLVVADPDNKLGNFTEANNVLARANLLFVPLGQFTFNVEGNDNPNIASFSRVLQ